jgi:AsmA protein
MTGTANKAKRRRRLFAATALLAAVGVGFLAPDIFAPMRGLEIPGSAVRAASPDSVVITAPLTLFESPVVTLEQGTVALASAGNGESRVGAVLRALMLGGGADLVLGGGRIVVDRTGSAAPAAVSTPADEPLGPLVSALAQFKFGNLSLIDTTIVVKTERGTEIIPRVNAEVGVDRHETVTAKGELEFRGETLKFDISFALPRGKADAPLHVRADVTGRYIALDFAGKLAPGDRGQITAPNATLTVSDVRGAVRWLGSYWLSGPGLATISAKGQLALDEHSMSFENAQFALDGNVANGALTAKLGDERASLEGTLAFATFDIAPYASQATPYALSLATDWLSTIRLPGLASPSLLREIDADIRISAANLTNGANRLGRCATSLSLKNGKLYGEIAELELDQGGSGEGQFTIDMGGEETSYALHADLKDIDFSGVSVAPLAPRFIADGTGGIVLELTAHGATEAEIARSLSGTVAVNLEEGGLLGIDLNALPVAATAEPPVEGWGKVGAGTTPVDSLAARFVAAKGTLTADAVEARAGDRKLTVTGAVDVDNAAVDLVLSLTHEPAAAEATGQQDSAVAGAGKPVGAFKVKGPWTAPTITSAPPGKSAVDAVRSGANPG